MHASWVMFKAKTVFPPQIYNLSSEIKHFLLFSKLIHFFVLLYHNSLSTIHMKVIFFYLYLVTNITALGRMQFHFLPCYEVHIKQWLKDTKMQL